MSKKEIKNKSTEPKKQTKQSKQKQKNNSYLTRKVPYINCFEELGMIESIEGVYSRSYEIKMPETEVRTEYDVVKVRNCMEDILSQFVQKFTCQMLVRNSTVNKNAFLNQILLPEHKEREVNLCIEAYNDIIQDNIDIGHNNYKRTVYFILSTKADTPDEALEIFKEADAEIKTKFSAMYGYIAYGQNLNERLYNLYEMFHPNEIAGSEGFAFYRESNKKLGTKELIRPSVYECKNRDYMKVGNKYVRMLFINSLPTSVPDSVLNDLMSVSSNSILSVIYEPIDTELGAATTNRLVEQNTNIRKIAIRDTIEDRKNHRTQEKREAIIESESTYFQAKAEEVFKEAEKNGEPVMLASFIIGLFSDSKEDLDRDTKLLRLSASKYASQIRIADLMQDEAFQSMLPLGYSKLNVYRTFRASQLAAMQPLDVQQLFNKIRTFHGLNGISDNLVLLDRKNYLTGLICGVNHSGKSFAMKREIANTLMSTSDEVILLTMQENDYGKFLKSMNTPIRESWNNDIFLGNDRSFTKLAITAFTSYRLGIRHMNSKESTINMINSKIEVEADRIYSYGNWNATVTAIREDMDFYENVVKALRNYKPVKGYDFDSVQGRLKAVKIDGEDELVYMLVAALNYIKRCKQDGKDVWLFVDSIDPLLYTQFGSDFLISLISAMESLKTPITMVVQDSVHIMTHPSAVIEYDYLLGKTNYYKLLTQGPIERRRYIEKLNIPESLVTYITDREPGEGIIITPSANISFNDRFESPFNEFYSRFHK